MKLITTLLLCVSTGLAQDFVNLTFNNPDLTGSLRPFNPDNPRTPFVGGANQLFRGWTLLGNGIPLQNALYQPGDGDLLGPVTLIGRQNTFDVSIYSSPPNIINLVFRQTGTVPANAVGLSAFATGYMEFLVNGELIGMTDPANLPPTFDISRFAGQTVTFDFRLRQNPVLGAAIFFDIGGFTQVPEPSTWALFGVGAAGLAWAGYRQRKS